MSLRFALVALLTGQPMTGYEVSKRFGASVGHVWHAPDSQIYPELRRMEADGLLVGTAVPWGTSGTTKTRYDVTDAGREAFREWMCTPARPVPSRDPAFLRAAYLDQATPAAARAQLRAVRDFHTEQAEVFEATRATLADVSHPVLAARLDLLPRPEWERIIAFRIYAYDGLVARERTEARWAQDGLALVDELAADDEHWKSGDHANGVTRSAVEAGDGPAARSQRAPGREGGPGGR